MTHVRRWGSLTAKEGKCWTGQKKNWGYTIVERSPGGKNGGGARVSDEGLKLLEKYERFEKELTETAAEKYREIFH